MQPLYERSGNTVLGYWMQTRSTSGKPKRQKWSPPGRTDGTTARQPKEWQRYGTAESWRRVGRRGPLRAINVELYKRTIRVCTTSRSDTCRERTVNLLCILLQHLTSTSKVRFMPHSLTALSLLQHLSTPQISCRAWTHP